MDPSKKPADAPSSPTRRERPPVHRRALRAAAAVTLTVGGAAGCSGAQKSDPATPEPAPKASAAAASPASAPPATGAPASPAPDAAAPAGAVAAKPDLSTPPNCRSDQGGFPSACCRAARAWCAAKHSGTDPNSRSLRNQCSFRVPGCNPWGPPAPPAFVANRSPRVSRAVGLA